MEAQTGGNIYLMVYNCYRVGLSAVVKHSFITVIEIKLKSPKANEAPGQF